MSRFGRPGPVLLSFAALGLVACAETAPRNDVVWGRPAPVHVQPAPSYGYYGRPPWVRNGVCEDDRYQTSNKGAAPAGEDEYDCLLFGNGLKAGRVNNEGEYARNGVCDDPNYIVTTGRARRGTDDYDCSRSGQGLRGVHQRGGLPAFLPSTGQPEPRRPADPRPEPPATEPERPEILGRGAIRRSEEGRDDALSAARAAAQAEAAAARQAMEEQQRRAAEDAQRESMRQTQMDAERAAQIQAERQAMAEEAARREAAQQEAAQREAAQREAEEAQRRMQEEMERQRQEQQRQQAPEPEREGQRVIGRGLIERQP